METLAGKNARTRLAAKDHPENRPMEPEEFPDGEIKVRPPSFGRALAGMWLAGAVGGLLAVMTIAYPLGAGDTVAALCVVPLMITLIALVNGWIAANLFLDPGLHRRAKR